jgi:hypothetical protein
MGVPGNGVQYIYMYIYIYTSENVCRFNLMEIPYFQTNPDDNSDISTRSALVPVFLALEELELPSGSAFFWVGCQ